VERGRTGLAQRLRALNHFIDDVYNDRRIIADGVFPADLLDDSTNYRPECQGIHPKFGVWAHISGSDLVRAGDGQLYVLEDNLRVPSGVSYVLENRAVAKRTFPELFQRHRIRPVDAYTDELNRLLASLAPDGRHDPCIAVLTPGIFNSAYFEHSFLAQRMGAELVEGQDLVVGDDDCVYMKTIQGFERVDVIYRRIDDLFIDPEAFLPDSMLGVAGLMRAWKAGNVGIANAPGAGVADDKVVYAWVPDMIRYYLGEEPLIPNVPTYRCMYDDERARAGQPRRPRAQAGQRERRVRHRDRQPGERRRIGDGGRVDPERSAQLGGAADPRPVDGAHARRRRDRATPPRPASVHPHRRGQLRHRRRPHARGAHEGFARRQLLAGRRQQGHVDRRHHPAAPGPVGGRDPTVPGRRRCRHGLDAAEPVRSRLMALLSRVADRMYWAARYVERAEDSARVLRSYGDVLADLPTSSARWSPLVTISGSNVKLPAVAGSDESQVAQFLIADREHPNSIVNTVEQCRENLRTCREVLPREAWQTVNDLSIYVRGAAVTSVERRRRDRFLSRVIDESRRLDGVLQSTMTRDEVFEMWRLGRYIERADMTTRVLGVRAASLLSLPAGAVDEFAEVQWMGVLRSLSALQMYQRATRGHIDGPAVVRFLLFDHRFPRSVAGCLAEMRTSILRLPEYSTVLGALEAADRQLRRSRPAADDGVALDAAMDDVQNALARLNGVMYEQYVVH
jgi:uncharacterized alpha-E superfamily protein